MALGLLAFACLLGAAIAGPYQREAETLCSTECPATPHPKFSYKPGSKYVYNFRTSNEINVAGNRKQQKAEMSGIADIYVKDRCEMALQLRNVELHGDVDREEASSFAASLEATPLSFSWVDGKIEHVCASPQENVFSENTKKGILSSIVNTMPDWKSPASYREVDSLGSCDTEYTIVNDMGSVITIRKEKSLKSCDNRHSGQSALITNPYASPDSDIQTLPVFTDEKLSCEQEISEGIIKSSVCRERAMIQPVRKYESLIELHSEIHLTLIGVEQGTIRAYAPTSNRKTILYNYVQDEDTTKKEKEAEEILTELCSQNEHMLHPSVSKLFYKLITVLKGLPYESVFKIYESLRNGQLCASEKTLDIFLDALPMAGTEGTIKLMVRLLRSKQITGLKAEMWPASFALIPNPNAEAIAAILPLLTSEERSRPVLLGMSAMIYRVCSQVDCDNIPSVREAVATLHSVLGEHCSSEKEDETVSVLKAFGNMGYLGQAEETVLECIRSKSKPITVRLAAIDAFRRYKKAMPSPLVDIYADKEENFEVRIAALYTIINQVDENVLKTVKQILEGNDDEQVVSFTRSLVKNLQETSSPLKKQIKDKLANIETSQVNASYWQNSKNIEFSAFNVPINIGAAVESNIIHSPESKLPRSFSTRIDIDLFGKNINLFEIGGRVEGIEQVFKKLLGKENSRSMKSSWFRLTSSRDAEESSAKASLYVRTMGTEFFDMSVSDLNRFGKMMEFADIMSKLAEGQKTDFAHSFLFLNNKLVIQSITGRSYNFGVTGSATLQLSANGKLDVVDLMSYPQNCDIQGQLQPSANVELVSTIGIHSKGASPSIKIVSSFNTGADVGAKFRVKDGHMVEGRLEVPSEEISLLKVGTELFEVDAEDNERPVIHEMERKIDHCINALEKPLGLRICSKIEIPRPLIRRTFPYAMGLGKMELSIKKTDPSMKSYIASLEIPKRSSDLMMYRLLLDTPGSSVNRKFEATFQLKQSHNAEKEFNLDVQCPFKDLSASGSYTWRRNLFQSSVGVNIDKRKRYSLKAVVEISSSGSEKTLKPTLQLTMPTAEPLTISGTISYTKSRKEHLMVDLRSSRPGEKPFVFTGNWRKEGRLGWSKHSQWKMSTDLVTKSPVLTIKMHSSMKKEIGQSEAVVSSVSLDYETKQSSKQSIKFSSGIRKNQAKVSASAQFECTQAPHLNWVMNWDMVGNPKQSMKNDLVLKYSSEPELHYVQVSQAFNLGDQNSLSEGKISLKAPQWDIDSQMNILVNLHPKETSNFHVETDLRYKPNKHLKSLIQLKRISRTPVRMSVKAVLEYPGRKVMYEDNIQETTKNIFEGRSKLQWQENRQATLDYKYKKTGDGSTKVHEIETTLKAPFLSKPATQKGMLKITEDKILIRNEVTKDTRSSYSIVAELSKTKTSRLAVSVPMMEGTLVLTNLPKEKSAHFDMQVKSRKPRRISGATILNLGEKKSLEAELNFHPTRDPAHRLSLFSEMEIGSERSSSYRLGSKLQVMDIFAIEVLCKGSKTLKGTHEVSVELSRKGHDPVDAVIRHEIASRSIHSTIKMRKNRREIAAAEMQGKLVSTSGSQVGELSLSMKSAQNLFKDKEIYFKNAISTATASFNMQTILRMEYASDKLYQLDFEYSRNSQKPLEVKLGLQTPWKNLKHQELSFVHQGTSDGSICNLLIQYNNKEVSMTTVTKARGDRLSVTSMIKSPFAFAREVEHHVSFVDSRRRKSLETYLEVNGDKKYDTSISYSYSQGNLEIQYSLKSSMTPEVKARLKSRFDKPSFSHELLITKGASPLLSAKFVHQVENNDYTCTVDIESSKQLILGLKFVKETKEMGQKFSMKAKGPFTPITMAVQLSRNDQNSLTVVANGCREASERQCYNVKGYYKKESSSGKYIRFRKVTLDIEETSDKGSVKHLCNIHCLFSQQENYVKSKFFIDSKGNRIGYDVAMKIRQHDEEPHELDMNFFLPQSTMKSSISALYNKRRCLLDVEITPDASTPSRKLSAQWKREWNQQTSELDGHLVLKCFNYEPFKVRYFYSKMENSAKVEVDYSSKPEGKFIAEVKYQPEKRQPSSGSLTCSIRCPAFGLDMNAVILKKRQMDHDSYRCQWTHHFRQLHKTGEMKLDVYHRKYSVGIPQKIDFEATCGPHKLAAMISSPHGNLWPSESKMELRSNDQVLGGVSFHRIGKCMDIECYTQEPVWKHHICFTKTEERSFKVVSVESYHRNNKCFDLNIELDPSAKHMANVTLRWKSEEFRDAAENVKKMSSKLTAFVAREYERLSPKIAHVEETILKPYRSLALQRIRSLVQQGQEKLTNVKDYIQQYSPQIPNFPSYDEALEIVENFINRDLPVYIEKLKQVLHDYVPENWINRFEKWVSELEKYIKEHCRRGTFCFEIKSTYQRRGLKGTHKLLKMKVNERIRITHTRGIQKVNEVKSSVASYFLRVWAYVQKLEEFAESSFSQLKHNPWVKRWLEQYGNALTTFEKVMRQYVEKVVELVDEFLDHARRSESFIILSDYMQQLKTEVLVAWKKIDTKSLFLSIQEMVLEKMPRKWIGERFIVKDFNIQEGHMSVQLRHPFASPHWELLKNVVNAVKQKCSSCNN